VKYILIGQDGYCAMKCEVAEKSWFEGRTFIAVSWSLDDRSVCEWLFHSNNYIKFDGCSHWWFHGEDCTNDESEIDTYYHLCGLHDVLDHMRAFAFTIKCAEKWLNSTGMNVIEDEFNSHIYDQLLDGYQIVEEK